MKRRNTILAILFATTLFMAATVHAGAPKYVFFFLGDGMSNSQIQTTEAYLTVLHGGSATLATDLLKSSNQLKMCKFPVHGMQTTYDAHALMTDSASAGTAFACGTKTLSGVVGMNDTKTTGYKSVAQLAHEKGKKVGIVTSVSLDHATPAAFYASAPSRSHMNSIATQLAGSGYEFFGGGGFVNPTEGKSPDTAVNIWKLLTDKGYTVLNDRASIMALNTTAKEKVVCINPWLQDSSAMPYAIDCPPTNVTLTEMTEVAVNDLYNMKVKGKNGFFLMVEGGKIDWACHANDAVAAINDVIDFDNAVGVALQFYKKHPAETLIIVTGDHETGGMSVGQATNGYTAHYDRLLGQKCSFTYFQQNQWAAHKAKYADGYDYAKPDNLEANSDMAGDNGLLKTVFGIDYAKDLNTFQKKKLEDAYDMSMCGKNNNSKDENTALYGEYEPIIVTITHILNERASIGWTSYAHTGVPVPVFAQGNQSTLFDGFYDNTDLAKKMAKAMSFKETLPVTK